MRADLTLALDIEGTLIASAGWPWSRPGLHEFLSWAHGAFKRMVFYTTVPPDQVRQALDFLVSRGEAPTWVLGLEVWNPLSENRDLGSYEGHITHEWGLNADVDVPVFDRAKGGWALVRAALQALGPLVDLRHGRPGVVPVSKDADGEPCNLFRDIPEEAREAFENWIGGQSMPITLKADGLGCYVEDYERWLRGTSLAWPEARLKEDGLEA